MQALTNRVLMTALGAKGDIRKTKAVSRQAPLIVDIRLWPLLTSAKGANEDALDRG